MSDARFAYSIAAGTSYSDEPHGTTRGVFASDIGVAADGILKHFDGAVLVRAGDADPVWIDDSALHSAVLGDDATRWDLLAQQLAQLEHAGSIAGVVGADPKTKTFTLTQSDVQKLLDGAKAQGMDVTPTGASSWTIDTHTSGVKLAASYDANAGKATITIDAPWYVPNSAVWSKLEPLIPAHVAQDASTTTPPAPAPSSTTDAEQHVSYLEQAEQKISDAWSKAKELPSDAKKKVKDAASRALGTARDLARDVEKGTQQLGTALHDRAVAVKEKIKATAKDVGVAWLAGGVGVWLLIGGVLYFVFKDEGRREAAKHAATAALA